MFIEMIPPLNQNVTLITGLIFVVIQIVNTVNFEAAKCDISNQDGAVTAQCGKHIMIEQKDNNYYLPHALPIDLEVMEVTPNDMTPYARFDFYSDHFDAYPKLRRLIIRRIIWSLVRNLRYLSYADCFKGITSISHLEIINCSVNHEYTIYWPKHVKILNLDNNEFQSLDVHDCKDLQELNANGNKLTNIPKFHHPTPAIRTLYLKGSPLNSMTILDLAPLCELSLLELEFPPGAHYIQKNSDASYCDCLMLKKWAKEVEISGPDKLECFEPKTKDISCSQSIFEKAKKLRTACPLLKSLKSSPIFKILKTILFFILGLLLLACIVLYIIRHFHLREKWHHYHDHALQSSEGSYVEDESSSEIENDRSSPILEE